MGGSKPIIGEAGERMAGSSGGAFHRLEVNAWVRVLDAADPVVVDRVRRVSADTQKQRHWREILTGILGVPLLHIVFRLKFYEALETPGVMRTIALVMVWAVTVIPIGILAWYLFDEWRRPMSVPLLIVVGSPLDPRTPEPPTGEGSMTIPDLGDMVAKVAASSVKPPDHVTVPISVTRGYRVENGKVGPDPSIGELVEARCTAHVVPPTGVVSVFLLTEFGGLLRDLARTVPLAVLTPIQPPAAPAVTRRRGMRTSRRPSSRRPVGDDGRGGGA